MVLSGRMLDEEDVRRIVEAHYGDVLAYCRRHAPTQEDALDATQETFLRFVRSVHTYRDRGKPLAFLLTIARRICTDAYRKRGRSWDLLEGEPPAPDSDNGTSYVREALQVLPPEQREVLELRYDQGLRVQEIARVLGVSRFAAGRKVTAALEALKAELEDDGRGPTL